ncbi:SDR family oxidoreductase [Streptomyces sp. cg35]|uniref:SDR family oxidoreductase n=1 Tax=Streptomyces sp. cg35 TaxID=3421650 RepID=UPI003D176E8A
MTSATPSSTPIDSSSSADSPVHAVVMGGSSGIGEATAALFARGGAEVTITGRDRTKLDEAAARIGGKTSTYRMDATDQADIDAFFAASAPIDHLVIAISGAAGSGPFAGLDLADLAHGFDAKFWPQLRVLQAALDHLTEHASVTFVTAASARAAFPGTSGLAAINGALESMVPPLAVELAPRRINAVSPGVIDTPWWDRVPAEQRKELFAGLAATTPVGRVGTAGEVAAAINALATNGFITGTVLDCTGGANLATGR